MNPGIITEEKLGENADVPDRTTGLTPREKYYIRASWALIDRDIKSAGIKFFML